MIKVKSKVEVAETTRKVGYVCVVGCSSAPVTMTRVACSGSSLRLRNWFIGPAGLLLTVAVLAFGEIGTLDCARRLYDLRNSALCTCWHAAVGLVRQVARGMSIAEKARSVEGTFSISRAALSCAECNTNTG